MATSAYPGLPTTMLWIIGISLATAVAERYGVDSGLVDFGASVLVPFADLVEEMIELVRPDAEALDCVAEVEHTRTICARGTSADRQLAVYSSALEAGATPDEALKAVVDSLVADTVAAPETNEVPNDLVS